MQLLLVRVQGIVVACVVLVFLASCGASTNPTSAVCGDQLDVKLGEKGNVVLTPASPNFYLATPHTAGSHCATTFFLTYEWADSARRKNDATEPTIVSSASAFHVDEDRIYFPEYLAHDVGADILGKTGHSWLISFTDSYHDDSLSQCTYYIKFSSPGLSADSIRVSAEIDYHEEK